MEWVKENVDKKPTYGELYTQNCKLRDELSALERESPCYLCLFNPPSVFSGKPCCYCPATGKE